MTTSKVREDKNNFWVIRFSKANLAKNVKSQLVEIGHKAAEKDSTLSRMANECMDEFIAILRKKLSTL
jgi:hypothetical protein